MGKLKNYGKTYFTVRSCDYFFTGCDVNAVKILNTPLHYAARQQDIDLVTLLLEFGASISKTDNSGFKAKDVLPCTCPTLRQLLLHWESKIFNAFIGQDLYKNYEQKIVNFFLPVRFFLF